MTRAWVLLTLLLCAAGAAWADPFSAVAALSTFAGAAAGTTTFLGLSAGAWFYVGVAASVLGAANSRRKARKAQAAAKAEYNAGLQDRTATVLRTDPPWQVVYGRCIVGGFYSDIITTDKVQPNEVSDAATKPDAYKTAVVVMAAHEVEAFHEVYIDGIPIGPVDGDGWAANGASATVTFTHGSDLVNWTATPATDGVGFMLYGGTAPTGLVSNTLYYVRDKTADSFKLSTTPGGAPINFTSNGSGTITGRIQSPFFSEGADFRIRTFADELTFTEGPLLEVLSAYTGSGDAQTQVTVTIESGNRLVSAAGSGVDVTVNFSFTKDKPTVRVGYFHGAADQTTPAMLAEIAPSRYTSDHRLRGCAGVIVTLDLEDVRFQGGPPQITADLSGRLLFDPRDDSTAWSDNPALVVRDFLTAEWGFEVDEADVDDTTVAAAADACDELIDLVVGSTTTEDQPRFTCNGAFQTDAAKESTLADLVDSMGGAVSYGATYRLLAGTWAAPVLALTDDDLHGQIEVVQADTPTGELYNGIRGQLFLAGAQSPSDFNPYQNSVFAADDGRDLWTSTSLPFTNHLARARNLSRIAVEQTRSGQVIRYPAKMLAWPLEIGDRVTVTSAEYGLTTKAYRVTDWQWDTTSPVVLTLQEDAEEIYDLADAAVADPTPNTGLADPWAVPALDNVDATSGNDTLVMQGDGTIVPRVLVTWDAVANGGVAAGGRVEVLWRSQSATAWNFNSVPGADTSVYLYGCTVGDTIIIEARARNSLTRVGPSVYLSHVVLGKTDAPQDVADFAYAIKPGQVALTWDPCTDDDYDVTEIRVGASWEAGTFGWAGKASERNVARPPNGTYVLWAKHKNRSGVYSVNAATVTVVVDDSIDSGSGSVLVLQVAPDPVFVFADATTHTSATPEKTFTARLVNTFGTATWSATAYDAITAGSSIGAVTMGGSGNERTMTAAQFVAPGTSGSVRRVEVTATAPDGAADTVTVIRYDPSVTAPYLYLTDPQVAVQTDEAGEGGDYSVATTDVKVLLAGAFDTDAWSISITPDSGVTATINGTAGPVTGTFDVTVAVSAMTIPDGAVLVTATKGADTLTGTFRVVKRPATGTGYVVYWDPRSEIFLPVNSAGDVTSYADAWSVLRIFKGGVVDETADWSCAKDDTNCTSTLTGSRVDVTSMATLGGVGTVDTAALNVSAAGWSWIGGIYGAEGNYIAVGQNSNPSSTWDYIYHSTDLQTWSMVNVGASGRWALAGFDEGNWVLAESGVAPATRSRISSDGGLTWSAGGTLATGAQFDGMGSGGGVVLLAPIGGTTGNKSTDGGVTWASHSFPFGGMHIWHCAGDNWVGNNTLSANLASTDNGSTWSTIAGLPATIWDARGYAGRSVVTFNSTSAQAAYSDDGLTFVVVALPQSMYRPTLCIVRDVLYMIGSNNLLYTTDGKVWRDGGGAVGTDAAGVISDVSIDADYLPCFEAGGSDWLSYPLDATSETVGSVTVTATKAGEENIVRTLVVRKGRALDDYYIGIVSPPYLQFPATSDGVVTDYSNGTLTCTITKNGVDDTDNWAFAFTATHLTPSSGSGPSITITAMDSAEDEGVVTFVASKAGAPIVSAPVAVRKNKGGTTSGPRSGVSFTGASVTATYVGLKLTSGGYVQFKEGSGGSYVTIGQYVGAPAAGVGAALWVRVDVTGHALSSGTTGTFLQLSSDREWVLSDASSGTHRTDMTILLATSSGGANAQLNFGALQLIVP